MKKVKGLECSFATVAINLARTAHSVRDHIIISGDMDGVRIVLRIYHSFVKTGRVAQRIRHLTTNQGIAGSNPAVVESSFILYGA